MGNSGPRPIEPDCFRSGSSLRRPGLSRRNFLQGSATGALALGAVGALADKSRAQELSRRFQKIKAGPPQPTPPSLDPALLTLINRTTFGFSRAAYDEAALMGYGAYLDYQLDYESIDESGSAFQASDQTQLTTRLEPFTTLPMGTQEIFDLYYPDDQVVPALHLIQASIVRAVYSRRQLYERMVEFWTDHFNIDILDEFCILMKTSDDRDVIRQYAMSTFPDLLNASARSGAMLYYLDNFNNIVGHAQENYSRELMELHTMGVDGGFTQQDVEEVARCLTGWTLYDTPNFGQFVFYEPFHDFGEKTVLGQKIPAGGGESDGQTVLDILAYHPSTAAFISRKMCERFLSYDPPQSVVDNVTATYLATGGDIKAMLREILREDVLISWATPKIKRPFHLVASVLRSTGADVYDENYTLTSLLVLMGHGPFLWATPDGYPDTLDAWATAQHARWQFASWMFDGGILPVTNLPELLPAQGWGGIPGQVAVKIDGMLTGGTMSSEEIGMLQDFYDTHRGSDSETLKDTFGLAASLPSAQWY